MKYYSFLLLGLGFLLGLSSCYEEPDFALEPYLVGFDGENGIRYLVRDPSEDGDIDSLVIRVEFQDGNGDLGLISDEPSPILREAFFPLVEDGELVYYDPAIDGEFDCTKHAFVNVLGRDTIRDTLVVEYNPYYYNFEVSLFRKENGTFQEYDLRKELCRPRLGGRFSPLKEDFSNTKPLEGIIQYAFPSAGLQFLFRNDTLKVKVQIRDRGLNESNVIESRPFVLVSEGNIYVDEGS